MSIKFDESAHINKPGNSELIVELSRRTRTSDNDILEHEKF